LLVLLLLALAATVAGGGDASSTNVMSQQSQPQQREQETDESSKETAESETKAFNDAERIEESKSAGTAQDSTPPTTGGPPSANQRKKAEDVDFDTSNTDWGSYYDPQNMFCGKFDCYKILGFDYESFGRSPPDTKTITKRYRSLSRVWHPDKNKRRDAKSRFVKIARAYEVLTSKTLRKEYDDMRYDQELYFQKYGTNILWQYAPKSDTTIVLIIILLIANVVSWFSQKHRWQLVADRLIKAAVEDWSPSMGGTAESKQLREEALAALAQREESAAVVASGGGGAAVFAASNGTVSSSSADGPSAGKKAKGPKKVSAKEKKRIEQEALLPIVKELVHEMHDFGAGFHKPTWRDLFIVTLAKLPHKVAKEGWWLTTYGIRRLRKVPLSDEERRVLTERAVGPIAWETATDEERSDWVSRDLWVVANLAKWSDEQEINKLSASDRKHYMQMKKKGLLEKED
jgi:DnaJ homolog subfamily C member 25